MQKMLGRMLTVGGLSLAAIVGSVPAADAATTEFSQTQSLGYGPFPCGGSIRVWADTNPAWGDRAILNIQALPMIGLGEAQSSGVICTVGTTVAWHNNDTGANGSWYVNVVGSMYGSVQYSEFKPVGRGHITATVTTNSWNIPGHGDFVVP